MSVFVAVGSLPESPLHHLREHLRAALGDRAIPPLPHLSLYYIDEEDKGERDATKRKLLSELRILESGSGEHSEVKLACFFDDIEGEQDPELIGGFDGEEIWLVRCEGHVTGWEVMEKIPLIPRL